jgi:uncharacterized protein (DUF362 family)
MDAPDTPRPPVDGPRRSILTRRSFVVGTTAAVATAIGAKVAIDRMGPPKEPVAILRARAYDGSLVPIILEGLAALGVHRGLVANRSVMLKPNLVEPSTDAPHINTHPAFIRAAVEAFRKLDAAEVFVAEGQGHVRDSQFVLEQSGVGAVLLEDRIPFVDLNHDEVFVEENRLKKTVLPAFYLPKALQRADLVVSLPKMKVHHWAGVTLSMKNLFGVLPSVCYGWPKNVLHTCGRPQHLSIPQSIMDITAAVRPDMAIVDGVIGMEGDGPIMGTPKPSNLVLLGLNPVATDATGARLMGFDPNRIEYLKGIEGVLGPLAVDRIEQRAEKLEDLAQKFDLIDHEVTRKFRA